MAVPSAFAIAPVRVVAVVLVIFDVFIAGISFSSVTATLFGVDGVVVVGGGGGCTGVDDDAITGGGGGGGGGGCSVMLIFLFWTIWRNQNASTQLNELIENRCIYGVDNAACIYI